MWKICVVCLLAVSSLLLSCGHPTTLTGMSISPSTVTVVGLNSRGQAQFTAYGTFIHPSETRDITSLVNWTSAINEVATVDNKGLVTATGFACGTTIITATAARDVIGTGSDSAKVTAQATFTVTDPTIDICNQ